MKIIKLFVMLLLITFLVSCGQTDISSSKLTTNDNQLNNTESDISMDTNLFSDQYKVIPESTKAYKELTKSDFDFVKVGMPVIDVINTVGQEFWDIGSGVYDIFYKLDKGKVNIVSQDGKTVSSIEFFE